MRSSWMVISVVLGLGLRRGSALVLGVVVGVRLMLVLAVYGRVFCFLVGVLGPNAGSVSGLRLVERAMAIGE